MGESREASSGEVEAGPEVGSQIGNRREVKKNIEIAVRSMMGK